MEEKILEESRPLPYREPLNIFSEEFLKTLNLEKKKKIPHKIEYFTDDIEELIVKSALEIAPSIVEHAKEYKKFNKKFNIAIDGVMNIGKSTLMKSLHTDLNCLDEDMVYITLTGYNVLCYNIMYNGELRDSKGNVIKTINYQKHFRGNDDINPNYKELESDAVITNLNNLHKTVELLEELGKEYVIFFDECHTLLLDYQYRNGKISKEDYERIMERFERTINYVLDPKSKCNGVIWCSATMDVFKANDNYYFTKVFDLDLPEEYKVTTHVLKPVHLKGDNILSKLVYIVNWLKANQENAILTIYLNSKRDIDKLVYYLKAYIKKFRKDIQDEDLDKIIAIIHSENTEDNEALTQIQKNATLPNETKILIATSYMNAGVEVMVKGKAVDVMIFVDRKTFSLINEIQFTGRFRHGIRMLYLIAHELKFRGIMTYTEYIENTLESYRELARDTIEHINKYARLHNCSLQNAKESIYGHNEKDPTKPSNHIALVDGKYVVSETAIRHCIFLVYQQTYTLANFNTLTNAFYNHKTMHVENVVKLEVVDYTDVTLESLGLEKPKKPKSTISKKETVTAITKINELTTLENKEYIRKVLLKNNTEYIKYYKEVEEDGENSLLLVENKELETELATLLNSPRYKKAKVLFTNDSKSNEKLIGDILDIKIPNTKFTDRKMDNIVSNINSQIEEAPLLEQERVEKKIKKIDPNGTFVIESKKAVDLVITEEKPRNLYVNKDMKATIFESLAYSGALDNIDSINIEWNNDGTPTQFNSKNKAHVNIVEKALSLYFNLNKKNGNILSRKKLTT